MDRNKQIELLKKYNKEQFHILHALTVEGTMIYFAKLNDEDENYWAMVGLLHDIDFEMYPNEHCKKCIELLKNENIDENIINSICSHGYTRCSDVEPKHIMEKTLYAIDELTGLIGAAVRMRPSKSVQDFEVSSLKKKFKDKKFAEGCSRDVINEGAEMLKISLDELFEKTILAMRSCEVRINDELDNMED